MDIFQVIVVYAFGVTVGWIAAKAKYEPSDYTKGIGEIDG